MLSEPFSAPFSAVFRTQIWSRFLIPKYGFSALGCLQTRDEWIRFPHPLSPENQQVLGQVCGWTAMEKEDGEEGGGCGWGWVGTWCAVG